MTEQEMGKNKQPEEEREVLATPTATKTSHSWWHWYLLAVATLVPVALHGYFQFPRPWIFVFQLIIVGPGIFWALKKRANDSTANS